MSRLLDVDEITRQLDDLPGWRLLVRTLSARYDAPDFASAVALVDEVARTADQMNHHPDIDIRWKRVRFDLSTHSEGGVTQLDVELAHRIAEHAKVAGARTMPDVPTTTEIAIDATDSDAVIAFWEAGLGLVRGRSGDHPALRDPQGRVPTIWFQQMDPPRHERSRTHVDVYVPRDEAPARVQAVIEAGGRLADDSHAPAWWVLADAEGNELCVCAE